MPLPKADIAEAESFLTDNPDIETIDVLLPDMSGILRGKAITRDTLPKLFSEGVRLPKSNYVIDSRGQNVHALPHGSRDGDPDGLCLPVPGSLKPISWNKRPRAQVLTSMRGKNDEPIFSDPRLLLQQVIDRFSAMGLTPAVALEYEFYLFDKAAAKKGKMRPARGGKSGRRNPAINVYSMDELYEHEALFAEIHEACKIQDLPAETFVSEFAAGQFELNLVYNTDALLACDQAILLERLIRQIALKHDVIATFMAKPLANSSGSGMHIHCSLLNDNGDNIFIGDKTDPHLNRPISEKMRHAAAGLLASMPESMLIFAPTANSYRRLIPNAYAPVTGHWGGDNRTLPVRIPAGGDKALRLEHRVAGADANPYLVVAAVLAGIHHGLTNELQPPPPCLGNAFEEDGVDLPIQWPQALAAFEGSSVLSAYFSEEWRNCFTAARRQDFENHHFTIPALDYELYLMSV